MRHTEGISYGQPSNAIVERRPQRASLPVPSMPKSCAKIDTLASGTTASIWSITAQMRLRCLVSHQNKTAVYSIVQMVIISHSQFSKFYTVVFSSQRLHISNIVSLTSIFFLFIKWYSLLKSLLPPTTTPLIHIIATASVLSPPSSLNPSVCVLSE